MNVLIAVLLLVLILVVVAVGLLALSMFRHVKKVSQTPPTWTAPTQAKIEQTQMMGRELSELAQVMRDRYQKDVDDELAAYAEARRKRQPIPNPMPQPMDDGRLHDTKNKKAQFLVPENLTEEERQVLKDFYNL